MRLCLRRLKGDLKLTYPGVRWDDYKREARALLADLTDEKKEVVYEVLLNTLHDCLRGRETQFSSDDHGESLVQDIFGKLFADGLLFADVLFLRIRSKDQNAVDPVLKTFLPNW